MQAEVKTKNRKKLKVKTLVDSRYTHIEINEQLVKDKRIQIKLINFSFEVFNADRTKNREVTRVAPLEIKINGHKKQLEAVVTDLDGTDMFLGHDWLVKHNPECYELKSLELDNRTTLVLSNTRDLNRDLFTN